MPDKDMPEFDEFEADIMKNARKINSLSGQVSKLTENDVKRVSSVRGEEELVSTTVKIMKKMGEAVETMTTGIKNVTIGSLRYTKRAMGQYGRALSEDISIDKKNLMAMSLAKSTPIFGYFAAKFMETDVFKEAAQNIKDKMGDAVSFVGSKLKTVISAPFRGISTLLKKRKTRIPAETVGEEPKTGRRGVFSERGGKIHFHPIGKSKMAPMKIPKMQAGGYVEKGGLAKLHASEVVMPIDKLLDRIDEKIEDEADIRMNKMIKGVSIQQMRMLKRYGKTQQEAQSKAFAASYKDQYTTFVEPFNAKMIDAFSDLKTALLGQPNNIMISMRLMWQRFLGKHPVFLGLLRFSDILLKTLTFPITLIFKKFGGPFRWITRRLSKNPLIATSQILSRYAPASLGYSDNILTVLKDSLIVQKDLTSFFTGVKYGPTILKSSKKWSIFTLVRDMVIKGIKGVPGFVGRAKRKMFGGAEEIEEGEARSPITMTDRFDMMIDLLKEIAECSCKSIQNETFKDYIKTNGIWQKRSLDVEKNQLHEQKKHRGFFSRMRRSLSFIGLKMKNMAIKIGGVVMSGLKKTVSFFKSTIDTILAFIPGWMKIGLGLLLIPLVVKVFDKISPTIIKFMDTMAINIVDSVKRALVGEKTKEEFKKEEIQKKEKIVEMGKKMKKSGASPAEISRFVSKEMKEKEIGASLAERYEKFMGEDLGLFEKVWFKAQQSRAKVRSLFTRGFLDDETSLKNLLEEIKKGTMDPDKAGNLYLSALRKNKKISPEAYTMLTKAGPVVSVVDNLRTMLLNRTIYNHNGKYITQDQWFNKRAGFSDKAVARVGRTIDNKSFGIFHLEDQCKEATSRKISAKDMADNQEQRYADYMKDKMTPEAHHILTKDGNKDIANKLSSMIANNQLIFHDGKLNTAYQFLKKSDQLTWSDRFKTVFGLREMSPAMMLGKIGAKGLNVKEGMESFMKQYMPVNPYSTISTIDLKNEIRKGGINTAAYIKEVTSRLPAEQASAYIRGIMNNPKIVRAMQLSENTMKPIMDKTELATIQAKSAITDQLATIKSNKNVQAGMEGVQKATGAVATSMASVTSTLVNNITNNVTASQPQQIRDFLPVDADERELTTGDLK